MPKWIDCNTIEGELSETDFIETVNSQMKERITKEKAEGKLLNYGNDGYVKIYEEHLSYKSIPCKLMALRYFAVTRISDSEFELRADAKINSINKHVVVESEDGVQPPYDIKELLGLYEFLWHDSLHYPMENWTLRMQWEEMSRRAKEDCEEVSTLKRRFQSKVKELRTELDEYLANLRKP